MPLSIGCRSPSECGVRFSYKLHCCLLLQPCSAPTSFRFGTKKDNNKDEKVRSTSFSLDNRNTVGYTYNELTDVDALPSNVAVQVSCCSKSFSFEFSDRPDCFIFVTGLPAA